MLPEYFARLPSQIQAKVLEIEAFAGLPISVGFDHSPVAPTDPNPDRLAARVTQDTATILLRAPDAFPPDGVIHELLHIDRYWVHAVPQVLPVSDPDGDRIKITSQIENALEHLIIVPMEAQYGFDPYPYWTATARSNWESYPWPDIPDPWARRKTCLLGWLGVTTLNTDSGVRAAAVAAIRKEGFLSDVLAFEKRVHQCIGSKTKLLAVALHFLQIPRSDVALIAFDVRARRRYSVPLPPP